MSFYQHLELFISIVTGNRLLLSSLAVCIITSAIIISWFAKYSRKAKQASKNYFAFFDNNGKLKRRLGFAAEKHIFNIGDFGCLVATVLQIESKVSLRADLVLQALRLLSKRYPLLRMRITSKSTSKEGTFEDYFVEMEDPNTVDFQQRSDLNACDWLDVLNEETHHKFNHKVGPLWRVILLREQMDSNTGICINAVLFTFNHAICDGRSIMELYSQFLAYLNRLESGENITVESLPLLPPLSQLIERHLTPKAWEKLLFPVFYGTTSHLQNIIFKQEKLDPFLAVYPPLSEDPSVPKAAVVIPRSLTAEETLKLTRNCKAQGCTVHGAITAAAALAVADMIKVREKATVPPIQTTYDVSIRTDCSPVITKDHVGFFVSACCPLQVVVPEMKSVADFWMLAKDCSSKVKHFVSEKRHLRRLKLTSNFGKLIATFNTNRGTGRLGNVFNLHLSNTGKFEIGFGSDWVHNFNATYYASSISNSGPVFLNNIVSVNGKLFWSFVYYRNITTATVANDFADKTLCTLKKYLVGQPELNKDS